MSEQEQTSSPLNILLLEDREEDVILTQRAFKKVDYDVQLEVKYDGGQAMTYLEQLLEDDEPLPQMLLMDINMPKKNGLEVLAELKAHRTLNTLPVVMLTSSKNPSDVYESYHKGAAAYLVKPIGFQEFLNLVQSLCGFWNTVLFASAPSR